MDKSHDRLCSLESAAALPQATARLAPEVSPCSACPVRPLAVCTAMPYEDLKHLAAVVTTIRIGAGQPLFDEGEPADHCFIVTKGAIKVYKLLPDGRRQVTGFVFVADFLGLANKETYVYSAEALSSSELCRFRREELEDLLDRFPQMEKGLFAVAKDELAAAQERILLLGRKWAKERIASFLLMLSSRAGQNSQESDLVSLPMSRADIGDYLGLSTETVSRTLTELKQSGVIHLESKSKVRMLDRPVIETLAGGGELLLGL